MNASKFAFVFSFWLISICHADVQIYESTYTLERHVFGERKDRVVKSWVIENDFIKTFVVPEYGGRVMSLFHKGSGTEQLYRASEIHRYTGPFYWNGELEVPGGVFSTFPFNEHGHTWNLPWEFKIVENTPTRVSVEMSYHMKDFFNMGQDETFSNSDFLVRAKAMEQLRCVVTVTIKKGMSYFNYNVRLENVSPINVDQHLYGSYGYEYWTTTTFAPGSQSDSIFSPGNTLIVVPIDRVECIDWYLGLCKTGAYGNYSEYSRLEQWESMGILYTQDRRGVSKNWWGAINLNNNIGVLRIADNQKYTPGIKFWTWGKESVDPDYWADEDNAHKRPHIELWGGHGHKFGDAREYAPYEVREWDEYYYSTFDLDTINYANQHGAIQVVNKVDSVEILFSATRPFTRHRIQIGAYQEEFISANDGASKIAFSSGCFGGEDFDIDIFIDEDKIVDYLEPGIIANPGEGACGSRVIYEGDSVIYVSSSSEPFSSSSIVVSSSSVTLSSSEELSSSSLVLSSSSIASSSSEGLSSSSKVVLSSSSKELSSSSIVVSSSSVTLSSSEELSSSSLVLSSSSIASSSSEGLSSSSKVVLSSSSKELSSSSIVVSSSSVTLSSSEELSSSSLVLSSSSIASSSSEGLSSSSKVVLSSSSKELSSSSIVVSSSSVTLSSSEELSSSSLVLSSSSIASSSSEGLSSSSKVVLSSSSKELSSSSIVVSSSSVTLSSSEELSSSSLVLSSSSIASSSSEGLSSSSKVVLSSSSKELSSSSIVVSSSSVTLSSSEELSSSSLVLSSSSIASSSSEGLSSSSKVVLSSSSKELSSSSIVVSSSSVTLSSSEELSSSSLLMSSAVQLSSVDLYSSEQIISSSMDYSSGVSVSSVDNRWSSSVIVISSFLISSSSEQVQGVLSSTMSSSSDNTSPILDNGTVYLSPDNRYIYNDRESSVEVTVFELSGVVVEKFELKSSETRQMKTDSFGVKLIVSQGNDGFFKNEVRGY